MRCLGRMKRRHWAALTACLAVYGGAIFVGAAVQAQAVKSIVVAPDEQLTDAQYVDVRVSGFDPGQDVRIRLCPLDADEVSDCAKDESAVNAPGRSRVVRAGSVGSASTPFVIKAFDIQPIEGDERFQCDFDNPCQLVAFALTFEVDEEAGDFREVASFDDSVSTGLTYALSTLVCPQTEPRVAGSGASSIRANVFEWQAETCRAPRSLNVSYATNNSVNGKMAFAEGLTDSDFAMSAVSLTTGERQTLADREVEPLHVPVALGSLVLAYNFWEDKDADGSPDQITDLQLSPSTAASIMRGRMSNWADPAIKADNVENYPNGFRSRPIKAVGRADNSAATWWLTSWFCATAKEKWEEEGGDSFKCPETTIFPAGNGVQLFTGTDKVALQIREFAGESGSGGIPDVGMIGFVYYSEALKLGLPVVALKNAAGEYVKPSDDGQSVIKAAEAGTVDEEGVFTPDFLTPVSGAYPLPIMTYAIVPAADTALEDPQERLLQSFLAYTVDEGQEDATLRGYAPLPQPIVAKSNASIANVYKQDQGPATPTPVPTATPELSPTAPAAGDVAGITTPAPEAAAFVTDDSSAPSAQAASGQTTDGGASAGESEGLIVRRVSGLIRLLGGGGAPITVTQLIVIGAVFVLLGRVLTHLVHRRRLARSLRSADTKAG